MSRGTYRNHLPSLHSAWRQVLNGSFSRPAVHFHRLAAEGGERRAEQRHFDDLPLPGTLALVERDSDGDGAPMRAEYRRERQAVVDGAVDVQERKGAVAAGGRAQHAFPGLHPGPGIIGKKARQRKIDEARVARRHFARAETETIHDAGPEVFDHDIGAVDQAPRDLEIGLRLEVERDAALVAVPRGVRRRIETRAARRIDADHVGAEIAEQHRRHGPAM